MKEFLLATLKEVGKAIVVTVATIAMAFLLFVLPVVIVTSAYHFFGALGCAISFAAIVFCLSALTVFAERNW